MKHLLYVVLFIVFVPLMMMLVLADLRLSGLSTFFDPVSLIGFLLAYCGVLLLTREGKVYVRALNALFSAKYSISREDRLRAVELFKLLVKITNYTSLFMTFVGLVGMLMFFEDISTLGPMISISLIAPMYGALINIIFILPAIHILKNRKNPEDTITITEQQVIDKLLELCHKQGLTPEEIMEADEMSLKK